ncbi:thioredoxin [Methanomassiliicoccales archaeon RumEn M1]|nr:thioredoxin [Methanomassiliicoccales archaeon RumEn M1]
MTANVIVVEPGRLDEAIEQNNNLIVDCWADWCGPCRMLSPIIDRLAEDYAGKVSVAKMNVDENQAEVQRFKIMAIPTVLFFKDGQLVDQMVGVSPKEEIEDRIRQHF